MDRQNYTETKRNKMIDKHTDRYSEKTIVKHFRFDGQTDWQANRQKQTKKKNHTQKNMEKPGKISEKSKFLVTNKKISS